METALTIAGGVLGVLVPVLFSWVLVKGMERSPFDEATRRRYRFMAVAGVVVWSATVWVAAASGALAFHEGDRFPRFLIPLVMPVALGLALSPLRSIRIILSHTPVSALAGVQAFRFAGVAFFAFVALGILPAEFTSAGWGDLTTGALAVAAAYALSRQSSGGGVLFWAFSGAGLLDLANVAYLLLAHHPLYSDGRPSSAPAFEFTLVLIPALAAPMGLLLHLWAIRNQLSRTVTSAGALGDARPRAI